MVGKIMQCVACASIVVLCTVTTVAAVEPTWQRDNVNSEVNEFFEELYDVDYFKTFPAYTPTIQLTDAPTELGYTYTEDNLHTMLFYLNKCENGKLTKTLTADNDQFAKLLGYSDYKTMMDACTVYSSDSQVDTVEMYPRAKGVTVTHVYSDCGLEKSDEGAILQMSDTVCKCLEYKNKRYWIIAPGFVDYSFSGDYMYLFPFDGACRGVLHMPTLFDAITGDVTDTRTLKCWTSDLACFVVTDAMLGMWTEGFFRDFVDTVKCCTVNVHDYVDTTFTSSDMHKAIDIFEEYLGYVPYELEYKLGTDVPKKFVDTSAYEDKFVTKRSTKDSAIYCTIDGPTGLKMKDAYTACVEVEDTRYWIIVPTLFADKVTTDADGNVKLSDDCGHDWTLNAFDAAVELRNRMLKYATSDMLTIADRSLYAIIVPERGLLGYTADEFAELEKEVCYEAEVMSAVE